MFEIQVLGTGAANDPSLPNSSAIVTGYGTKLLIDCGYSVAREVLLTLPDPNAIDAIFFTHHHPDHAWGFAPVVTAWQDYGRRKPLLILATRWGRFQLEKLIELGFGPNWQPDFQIDWHLVPEPLMLGDMALSFAPTDHTVPNHAVRIACAGRVFAYSGDGRATPQSIALYRHADLLFHECHLFEDDAAVLGHASLRHCRDIARQSECGEMMLYHIEAGARADVTLALAHDRGVGLAPQGGVLRLL
ncbi:MBL fold metallo-hydrolase [Thalassospira mesophila]|uniref:MBL fold metallo-hydrolase n=1 Tax=Thalassospira mesophila TaxID=1293891 RepID=UPI000A1E4D6D|nr:ribonuclease Z [Thalassospira mesophila]